MRVCVRERIAQCADEGVTEGPHIFTLKAPKITSLKDKLHNSRLRKKTNIQRLLLGGNDE